MKLEVQENKKLKLVNVLTKELRDFPLEEIDHEVEVFDRCLKSNNIQTRGPLITKTIKTKISEVGELLVDCDILRQVREKQGSREGLFFREEITVENCLYLSFKGASEDLMYARNKMALHLWEKDLIGSDTEYMIHLSENEHFIEADIFRPLE